MRTSLEGIRFIGRWEGFSPTVYKDVAGFPTIGYGHLLKPGDNLPPVLTERDAVDLLRKDVEIAEEAVNDHVTVVLDPHEFDALVSFTYNLGGAALRRSTLLRLLNSGNKRDAAGEFEKWVNAGGKRVQGLANRREAERLLFTEGDYGDDE